MRNHKTVHIYFHNKSRLYQNNVDFIYTVMILTLLYYTIFEMGRNTSIFRQNCLIKKSYNIK